MIKVLVYDRVDERKNGDGRTFLSQRAVLECPGDAPLRFMLSVDEPLVAGEYELTADAFACGKYERLELASFGLAKALRSVSRSAAVKAA